MPMGEPPGLVPGVGGQRAAVRTLQAGASVFGAAGAAGAAGALGFWTARTKTHSALRLCRSKSAISNAASMSMAFFGVVGQESTHWAQWMHRSLWMTILNVFSTSLTWRDLDGLGRAVPLAGAAGDAQLGMEEGGPPEILGDFQLLEGVIDGGRFPEEVAEELGQKGCDLHNRNPLIKMTMRS